MQQNLIRDISALTAVSNKTLNKIVDVAELCFCDYINELDITNEDVVNIDIGIGTLSLLLVNDSMQYQFTPSYQLEQQLINTIESKTSPLVNSAQSNLEHKLRTTYKELL